MGRAKSYTAQTLIQAIKGSGGIISTIAKKLDCEWFTARKYIDKWEETKRAYLDEQEVVLDMAEGTLLKSIQEGDVQSAKWILSTKGKKRGYSEKLEIQVEKSDSVDISALSEETRNAILDLVISTNENTENKAE